MFLKTGKVMVKCNNCRKEKSVEEFSRKKDGDLRKTCDRCIDSRNCIHNKWKSSCKDCNKPGEGIFCSHNKRKSRCKDCNKPGEGSICSHNKQKSTCKDCNKPGEGSLCAHNRVKRYCKDCGGSGICSHNKQKNRCRECGGSSFCIHNKQKNQCKDCSPNSNVFCLFEGCYSFASFGLECDKKKLYCADHCEKTIHIYLGKRKMCTSCSLFCVRKKNNYLCSYCNPDSTLIQKTKEFIVKTFLEENEYKFEHNKQIKEQSCNKYRPDFLFDLNTHFLIIEVDEFGHKEYPTDCEMKRMYDIQECLGMNTVFIRYNPDSFKINNKTVRTTKNQRLEKLKETIEKYFSMTIEMLEKFPNQQGIIVEYLFYDQY